MFKQSVVVIIYNRPDHTRRLFEQIERVKPHRIFIIADGPKYNNSHDKKKCEECREIFNQVDWTEDIHKNFAASNMGLKARVSSGLDWVFTYTDQAIILEDDCIPSEDFFSYCSLALEEFKSNDEVSVITGDNFQNGIVRGDGSYYFSKYNHCWGWATWKRAWKLYDGNIEFWPDWKLSEDWSSMFQSNQEKKYWTEIFEKVYRGELNSWAYPWTASVWKNGGLTVTPNVNLVENIGFDDQATNTFSKRKKILSRAGKLKAFKPPSSIELNTIADDYVFRNHFGGWKKEFPYTLIFKLYKLKQKIFGKL
jgi:hypothetical protein